MHPRISTPFLLRREIAVMATDRFPAVEPLSQCICPSNAPRISPLTSNLCVTNDDERVLPSQYMPNFISKHGHYLDPTSRFHATDMLHLPEMAIDGDIYSAWVSTWEMDSVALELHFPNQYQVGSMIIMGEDTYVYSNTSSPLDDIFMHTLCKSALNHNRLRKRPSYLLNGFLCIHHCYDIQY